MDKSIGINESTKNRLDALKGRKSYNSIIEEMLSYFEQTAIPPTSRITSPVAAMKEQSNRIIEVLRGIEKKQNIANNATYDLLKTISLGKRNDEKGEPISADNENYLHVSEVEKLVERHKELEELYNKSEARNKSLMNKVEELKETVNSGNSENVVNTNLLLEIVERLEETPKPATFNNGIYEIERTSFDALITRLKSELK